MYWGHRQTSHGQTLQYLPQAHYTSPSSVPPAFLFCQLTTIWTAMLVVTSATIYCVGLLTEARGAGSEHNSIYEMEEPWTRHLHTHGTMVLYRISIETAGIWMTYFATRKCRVRDNSFFSFAYLIVYHVYSPIAI